MIKTSGTKEWSDCSFNLFQGGCIHNCVYCYARRLERRFNRIEFKIKENLKYPSNRKVMIPTTHDLDLTYKDLFVSAIIELLKRSNEILLVTKSSGKVLREILLDIKEKGYNLEHIEVRPSITTPNIETVQKYERNAAKYEDRLLCLKEASSFGCGISVSIEPFLCTPEEVNKIVWDITFDYDVSSIWIGALSYIPPEMKGFVDSIYTLENFNAIYAQQKDFKIIRFKDTFMNRYHAMKNQMSHSKTLDQFGGI